MGVLGRVGRLVSDQLTADFEQAGYSIMVEQFDYWYNLWEQDGMTSMGRQPN
jgi:hypothetical protein